MWITFWNIRRYQPCSTGGYNTRRMSQSLRFAAPCCVRLYTVKGKILRNEKPKRIKKTYLCIIIYDTYISFVSNDWFEEDAFALLRFLINYSLLECIASTNIINFTYTVYTVYFLKQWLFFFILYKTINCIVKKEIKRKLSSGLPMEQGGQVHWSVDIYSL